MRDIRARIFPVERIEDLQIRIARLEQRFNSQLEGVGGELRQLAEETTRQIASVREELRGELLVMREEQQQFQQAILAQL